MNSYPPPDDADDSEADPQSPPGRTSLAAARVGSSQPEGAARLEGIIVGYWRSVRLLIGWSWLALVVLVLGGAWWYQGRPGDSDLPHLAVLLLIAAGLGSLVQTWLRIELGRRFRRPLEQLTLTAIGYRIPYMAASSAGTGMQRLAIAAGPTLAVLAGGLAAAAAAAVAAPADAAGAIWGSPELVGDGELGSALRVAGWVWLTQAILMGLPIPGSVGRQILWGVVERTAQWGSATRPAHRSAVSLSRRVDRFQGVIAALLAAAAAWQWDRETGELAAPAGPFLPAWPLWIALAVLVWSGRGGAAAASREGGSAGSRDWDPAGSGAAAGFDSAAGLGPGGGFGPGFGEPPVKAKRRQLSWWDRWRIRRVQRAERGEAIDATRLDAVLERLHRDGFDSLSAADRTVLRRVSQRLRQNREGHS